MVSITLNNLGKKFKTEWVFRKLNFTINENDKLVILGNNGSGKSTLLQIISGFVSVNEGEIVYKHQNQIISEDLLHEKLSFASPYLQLIEELTLSELVEHCKVSKPFKQNLSTQSFIEAIDLKTSSDKLIKQFSSGMKQRVKLGLALYADTPLLLLDEPISNLDERSIDWYQNQLAMLSNNRTIIVCSNNIKQEFFCCDKSLNLMAFKN
ncbi:MAG: ATP-binding cassette domain-containing protein [Bacteroidetes bacterium]|nr:ATP-binding cassette domain-containing protein [Bacteroidota bacterium]